jgi:peroxiredoxin
VDAEPAAPAAMTEPDRSAFATLVGKPWAWALLVGTLFSLPMLKGGRDLPPIPPGVDSEPLAFELEDAEGTMVSLDELAGHLVVVGEIPLANAAAANRAVDELNALRKRLRGLGSAVVHVLLCHGGDRDDLEELLDVRRVRKPLNVFLVDEDRAIAAWLRREAGSESAEFFLLDRHGRLRDVFPGSRRGLDELVHTCGILANWPAADPELAD